MDHLILSTAKHYINQADLPGLQEYLTSIYHSQPLDYRLPIESLYQQIYLHACLRKIKTIATWMESLFPIIFDDIQQIALRQMFSYGRYLLRA